MSQQIKTTSKITAQQKAKQLISLKRTLKKVAIKTAQDKNGALIASFNTRWNHSNGKSAIPIVNKNGGTSFNYNQIVVIKSFNGEFDDKLGYWFISI